FKLHDITSGPEDPNREPLDMNQTPWTPKFRAGNGRFLTRRLWGCANEPPYFHHGRFTTLREAVLAHSGEALRERRGVWRPRGGGGGWGGGVSEDVAGAAAGNEGVDCGRELPGPRVAIRGGLSPPHAVAGLSRPVGKQKPNHAAPMGARIS